jgi:hypothetical protein
MIAGRALFLSALVAICAPGIAQTGASLRISPVPLWPKNADLSSFPPDQYVFLELPANNYVVAIRSQEGLIERLIRAPIHNQVAPAVTVAVSRDPDGRFHYRYTVSNGSSARTPIQRWAVAVEQVGHQVEPSFSSTAGPVWTVRAGSALPGISRERHEAYEWLSPPDGCLDPGKTLAGFEIVSDLAPGFILGVFYGQSVVPELNPEDWASLPGAAAAQLRSALATAWDGQALQVLGPRFTSDAGADVVQANFLFGVRDAKMRNRIWADSAVGKELESALDEALGEPGKVVENTRLDILSKTAKPSEGEIINAMKLTIESLGVR